jgi:hypothetical protein
MAERLNWLSSKNRWRKTSSHFLMVGRSYSRRALVGDPVGPAAPGPVAPRGVGDERDLAGPEAVAGDEVEVEVLEVVGAHHVLRALAVAVRVRRG